MGRLSEGFLKKADGAGLHVPVALLTRAVFLDDASVLAKLDPGMWPQRHGDIERRTTHDEITQACQNFLSCRLNPDDLETQLAVLSHVA
jgi:hypothetical protein